MSKAIRGPKEAIAFPAALVFSPAAPRTPPPQPDVVISPLPPVRRLRPLLPYKAALPPQVVEDEFTPIIQVGS